jgi:hypothetical protein
MARTFRSWYKPLRHGVNLSAMAKINVIFISKPTNLDSAVALQVWSVENLEQFSQPGVILFIIPTLNKVCISYS